MVRCCLESLILGLMIMYVNGNGNRFCETRAEREFDFFYLVQQWPGSFCSRGCCFSLKNSLPGPYFRIHGLWPMYYKGTSPCYCKKQLSDPFQAQTTPPLLTLHTEIRDELQDVMRKHWGPINCPVKDVDSLWSYQWTKHGSCSGMDHSTYFQKTIDLYFENDLTEAFARAGIFPDGRMYHIEDMRHAVYDFIGHYPIITCSFNRKFNVQQVYEVFICVDKVIFFPMECPKPFFEECNNWALFPVFKPNHGKEGPHLPRGNLYQWNGEFNCEGGVCETIGDFSPKKYCTNLDHVHELKSMLDEQRLTTFLGNDSRIYFNV